MVHDLLPTERTKVFRLQQPPYCGRSAPHAPGDVQQTGTPFLQFHRATGCSHQHRCNGAEVRFVSHQQYTVFSLLDVQKIEQPLRSTPRKKFIDHSKPLLRSVNARNDRRRFPSSRERTGVDRIQARNQRGKTFCRLPHLSDPVRSEGPIVIRKFSCAAFHGDRMSYENQFHGGCPSDSGNYEYFTGFATILNKILTENFSGTNPDHRRLNFYH